MGQITIIRNKGGLGRRNPSEDAWSGLVMNGVAVPGGAQLNTVYALNSVEAAEALGLTAQYDATNKVLVWHRIREYFRLSRGGRLFVMLVSQGTTLTQMADKTFANGLAKLLRSAEAQGKIRQAAIARNPATGYVPVNGGTSLDGDVLSVSGGVYGGAVVKAQELAEEEEALHRPVVILVEGRGFNGSASAATDLHEVRCPQVAVTIAQDRDVAAQEALWDKYAAVESLLGMCARRAVNECVGWVADGDLQDAASGAYVTPGLSNGTTLASLNTADWETLNEKGYILPQVYAGYPGVYFNDSYTCVELADDFCYLEHNRTIQKAIRLVYAALVPEINRPVPVNEETGKLDLGMVKYFESLGTQALDEMARGREVSGFEVVVDPDQNVLATSEVVVDVWVVPTGTARKIKARIGFKNPFNT